MSEAESSLNTLPSEFNIESLISSVLCIDGVGFSEASAAEESVMASILCIDGVGLFEAGVPAEAVVSSVFCMDGVEFSEVK
ncbi:hypothetical protein BI308_23765 [Roseofilum reptotaenium AO1-A]|uniref:Uncharacterized protein n=1 Tax=Roseofilum reptotaenium AO1-A TaxID=1925591 RepID=A0A1L9QK67_9CYAN|nr:hypothetical protein BI308_23765 [Roseofilum reptotaenium AO1-A]